MPTNVKAGNFLKGRSFRLERLSVNLYYGFAQLCLHITLRTDGGGERFKYGVPTGTQD